MISPSISNMSLSSKQKLCHEFPLPNHFLRVELNPQKRRGRFHRFSPTWQESISSMKREMMRAGLIEELLDEGMEEMVSWRCVNVWVGWSHDSILFSCWNLKSFFLGGLVWLINQGERGPWLVSFSSCILLSMLVDEEETKMFERYLFWRWFCFAKVLTRQNVCAQYINLSLLYSDFWKKTWQCGWNHQASCQQTSPNQGWPRVGRRGA